ncbi:MAG TPA: alpha/beta fold hydrolase [Anaeromyxobacteraceae bacterium]|nr:alpha/beta fold hydrolase [Anaeromyxobacteraceae bacterium]
MLWWRARRALSAASGDVLAGERVVRGNGIERRRSPVLLLQGFLATRRSLKGLERRLRRDAYGVLSLDLGGLAGRFNTRRIDELAVVVRDQVERLYARHPGMEKLVVIGHSEGGLIATYWMKRLGGRRRVRAVLTLATPHRGTPLAWTLLPFAPLAPSILQMTPGSRLVRALDRGAWPAGVPLTSLYSRQDRVVPYPSALVDGRGHPEIRNVEVVGTHADFLLKNEIYRQMARQLRLATREAARAAARQAA